MRKTIIIYNTATSKFWLKKNAFQCFVVYLHERVFKLMPHSKEGMDWLCKIHNAFYESSLGVWVGPSAERAGSIFANRKINQSYITAVSAAPCCRHKEYTWLIGIWIMNFTLYIQCYQTLPNRLPSTCKLLQNLFEKLLFKTLHIPAGTWANQKFNFINMASQTCS